MLPGNTDAAGPETILWKLAFLKGRKRMCWVSLGAWGNNAGANRGLFLAVILRVALSTKYVLSSWNVPNTMLGITGATVKETDISVPCPGRWQVRLELRWMGVSAAKRPWEELPPIKGQTDWHCRVRLGKLFSGRLSWRPPGIWTVRSASGQGESCYTAQKQGLHQGTQGWVEGQCTQTHRHADTYSSETAKNKGDRWKWSLL